MGITVAKLNEVKIQETEHEEIKTKEKEKEVKTIGVISEGQKPEELSEMLTKALLKVSVLEKKLKLLDELSLEFKEKTDITEIESQELINELIYRNNVNKVVLDDLENLDIDYLLENLDFSEEYLLIPILN